MSPWLPPLISVLFLRPAWGFVAQAPPTTGQEIAPWIAAINLVGLAGIAVWLIVYRGPQEARERREELAQARKEYFEQLQLAQTLYAQRQAEALAELRGLVESIRGLLDAVRACSGSAAEAAHDARQMAAVLVERKRKEGGP